MYEAADRTLKFQQRRQGLLITRPETGAQDWFRPVPPNQLTLEDFTHPPVARMTTMAVDGQPKGLRETAGYLGFGW
jgi:hypothetical protein